MTDLKILLLSKKFPYPLREGEPIAINYLSKSLVQLGCEVTLLVMNTTKHYFDPLKLPPEQNHFKAIHSVKVDNRITPIGALKSWLARKSYILSRFYSRDYEEKLIQVLKQEDFDVVQLETVYLAHYIPAIQQHSKALIAMRAHNVEHEIWERVARRTTFLPKKWYLLNQNKHLRKFELAQLNSYDMLVAITQRDLDRFRELGFENRSVVAPVGINLADYTPDYQCFAKKTSLAFIGALDWMPNQEAVLWFLEKVWPDLSLEYPGLEFHIAGKNTPDWLVKKTVEGVFFHGEVENAMDFINQHPILVAPLFSGSGIKIKVLEGMSLGRVVVTTPVGVEGIPATHGQHLFVCGTVADFIKNLKYCIDNQQFNKKMGIDARQFIGSNFDNLFIARCVISAYQNALNITKTA